MADNHIAQTLTILMQSVQQLTQSSQQLTQAVQQLVQLQQQHTLTQSVQQLTGQQLTQSIQQLVQVQQERLTYLRNTTRDHKMPVFKVLEDIHGLDEWREKLLLVLECFSLAKYITKDVEEYIKSTVGWDGIWDEEDFLALGWSPSEYNPKKTFELLVQYYSPEGPARTESGSGFDD
ncbi:hypothetical protein N656DRAFT_795518 [Canariomyces notabilis]|uniref:Uncharacterized protein n=1 Tax=Canariomyces notabilis TaxID=2074819 RepID=A0AAN6TKW7_9PEZI|nr:hypothetical protein N656DRAFT_795518 [Canariomyces arenarius]